MVAYDYSAGAGSGSSSDLIPKGQLAWAIITFRETKIGAGKGTKYHDLELTLDAGQPYEKRKVWHNLMDPFHAENSSGAKQMGMVDFPRILEAGRWGTNGPFDVAVFGNQGGYLLNAMEEMNGLRVAIKIGVEKGSDGYADKNVVADFLTPNPVSAAHGSWKDLVAGRYNTTAAVAEAPAQAGFAGFGAQAAPAAAPAAPTFGTPQAAAPAAVQPAQPPAAAAPAQPAPAPTQAFGAPAPAQGAAQTAPVPFGATTTASGAPTPTASAPPQANASTPSPSSPPADPNNWMSQANAPAAQ
jgi:hypothetical protein